MYAGGNLKDTHFPWQEQMALRVLYSGWRTREAAQAQHCGMAAGFRLPSAPYRQSRPAFRIGG
jgi:hypothetical protein